MKKQLLKSLIAILIFNAAFLISAKAQIVYTDVNPDDTVNTNGGYYPLDMNNDGTTDFNISIQTGSAIFGTGGCMGPKPYAQLLIAPIVPVTGNNVATTSTSPSALTAGSIINGTIIWSSSATLNMARDYWQCTSHHVWFMGHWVNVPTLTHLIGGFWINATDKYLGLKFISGGNTYYGWARLNTQVTSNGTAYFIIKDYAYNSIPNSLILAGQGIPTGIPENFSSSAISIYSFNKTLNIEFNGVTLLNGNVTVFNTLGQELKSKKIENSDMQIDMSDCNRGIYFVTVQTNEMIETKKIYLK